MGLSRFVPQLLLGNPVTLLLLYSQRLRFMTRAGVDARIERNGQGGDM